MNAHAALGAIAALTISASAFAGQQNPPAPPLSIHIGQMKNIGWGTISYTGDYREHVVASKALANGNVYPTLITINLSAIIDQNGANAFSDVKVVDSGANAYGGSPGADIDYFAFDGLPNGVQYEFSYDGPNPVHQGESAAALWIREAVIDTQSGASDSNTQMFVSLGNRGALNAHLNGWSSGGGGGGSGGGPVIPNGSSSGISLMLSEAGSGESFDVYVTTTTVPAPGAIALLGMAGLLNRRRRRVV